MKSKNNFERTADWLLACGKEQGRQGNIDTNSGVMLEELGELLDEIQIIGSGSDNDSLSMAATRIKGIAHRLKTGSVSLRWRNRVRALDAMCDVEVTINGTAFLSGFNKIEADNRVLASNESKLNADGTAVILPGGKIGKSPLYKAPILTDLV